jgi:methylmalonyl-CoA/ethylmalonyl-CoA epimerase
MNLTGPTEKPNAPIGQKLHHFGFVVKSIAEAVDDFKMTLAGTWHEAIHHDPLQKVHVTFLEVAGGGPLFELVEPAASDSPVAAFLRRGGGLHHVCFEVDDLNAALEDARAHGGLVTSPAQPAVAFSGRRIAWVYTRKRLLIEYLEACR